MILNTMTKFMTWYCLVGRLQKLVTHYLHADRSIRSKTRGTTSHRNSSRSWHCRARTLAPIFRGNVSRSSTISKAHAFLKHMTFCTEVAEMAQHQHELEQSVLGDQSWFVTNEDTPAMTRHRSHPQLNLEQSIIQLLCFVEDALQLRSPEMGLPIVELTSTASYPHIRTVSHFCAVPKMCGVQSSGLRHSAQEDAQLFLKEYTAAADCCGLSHIIPPYPLTVCQRARA